MPDDRYIVLLNDALKSHLLRLDERARARLREKFEFLENGFWDAGVRVKKLRGMAGRVVFEARLSRGDRLLFTLGSHRGRTAIYVWGLVSHDDISAGASRIVPGNAPFLDFEPFEEKSRRAGSVPRGPPPRWLRCRRYACRTVRAGRAMILPEPTVVGAGPEHPGRTLFR